MRQAEIPSSFDPHVGVLALEKLAEYLSLRTPFSDAISPDERIIAASVDLLEQAKHWLGTHGSPFDDFPGDVVLKARCARSSIDARHMAVVLQNTALNVLQVIKLVELRSAKN